MAEQGLQNFTFCTLYMLHGSFCHNAALPHVLLACFPEKKGNEKEEYIHRFKYTLLERVGEHTHTHNKQAKKNMQKTMVSIYSFSIFFVLAHVHHTHTHESLPLPSYGIHTCSAFSFEFNRTHWMHMYKYISRVAATSANNSVFLNAKAQWRSEMRRKEEMKKKPAYDGFNRPLNACARIRLIRLLC